MTSRSSKIQPRPLFIEGLHLHSLRIVGFRGIEQMSVMRLGRITLFIGINGSGKTTVLEAIDTYAARGRHPDLGAFLVRRGEFVDEVGEGESDPVRVLDFASLFHGRGTDGYPTISISTMVTKDVLEINALPSKEWSEDDRAHLEPHLKQAPESLGDLQLDAIEVTYQGDRRILPSASPVASHPVSWRLTSDADEPPAVECLFRQPGLPNYDVLVQMWQNVAGTEDEKYPLEALGLLMREVNAPKGMQRIFTTPDGAEEEFDDEDKVIVVGEGHQSRRLFVKFRGEEPMPLASLGDGTLRAFATVLALIHSRDGILLIDEADNGIDEALHWEYWLMLYDAACEYNVQIVATTHGLDCMKGFAKVAKIERVNREAIIIQLEPCIDGVAALEYDDWNLHELIGENDDVPNY